MRVAPRPWEEAYRLQGRLWRGVRLDAATRHLLDERPHLRSLRWLDAGCGDGKGLVPLASAIETVPVGVDASRQGLRLARAAAHEQDHGAARWVQADVRSLPFGTGTFGVVRAVHILGHLRAPDRQRAARELARVVADDGVLLATEFSVDDFRAGSGDEVEPRTYRRGHGVLTHYFMPDELETLLVEGGLRIESSEEERFQVHYGGVARTRSRVIIVARRQS